MTWTFRRRGGDGTKVVLAFSKVKKRRRVINPILEGDGSGLGLGYEVVIGFEILRRASIIEKRILGGSGPVVGVEMG